MKSTKLKWWKFTIHIFDFDSDNYEILCRVGKASRCFPLRKLPKKHKVKRYLSEKLQLLADVFTRREVHYWYSSTDCDHTHVEYVVSYDNIFRARESIELAYEDAEGATYFERLTLKQYEECKKERIHRNYVDEAHEDGHPYSVRG